MEIEFKMPDLATTDSEIKVIRWLVANGHRFGFHNYPFEPWHWEWAPA